MATEIYLGYPPQHVLDWIRNHSQPPATPSPYFTYDSNKNINGISTTAPSVQYDDYIGYTLHAEEPIVDEYALGINDGGFLYYSSAPSLSLPNVTQLSLGAFNGFECYNFMFDKAQSIELGGFESFNNTPVIISIKSINYADITPPTSWSDNSTITCKDGIATLQYGTWEFQPN